MEAYDIGSVKELQLRHAFVIDEVVIDSREVSSKQSLFVALKGKRQDGHDYVLDAVRRGAKGVLVKKGTKIPFLPESICVIEVDDPLAGLQSIAREYRKSMEVPVMAIGGAVGKTLIKDFLSELLKKQFSVSCSPESFNSQIGVPLSLLKIKRGDKVALIESAISEPGEIERLSNMLEPTYTLITSLEPAPFTRFSRAEWIGEWQKLMRKTEGGWILAPAITQTDVNAPLYFWDEKGHELPHADRMSHRPLREIPYFINFPSGRRRESMIKGNYAYFLNQVNMAIKGAFLLGLPEEAIEEGVYSASLELMRTEIFKGASGTTFHNAPYSSDSQSIIASLRSLASAPRHHARHFIFGGLKGEGGKEESLRRVGESIAGSCVDRLTLFGARNFNPLLETLREKGFTRPIETFANLEEALQHQKRGFFNDQTVLIKGPAKVPLEKVIELVNDSPSHNLCLIHLSALRHNLSFFRSKAPHKRLLVMVKAQGYGTNDWHLATFLAEEGIDLLGLSYVDEAVSLRRAGVRQDLFVLNAAPYEADKVAKFNLQVGVGDLQSIQCLEAAAAKHDTTVAVHLHIDTGMSRFGCQPHQALDLAEAIKHSPHLELEGLMTHLSAAEDPNQDAFSLHQVDIFQAVRQELEKKGHRPPWIHLSNSAGLLRFPEINENMVRLGLSIFGLHPSTETFSLPLKPAVSLQSKIVGINYCTKGASVSYGRSYIVERDEAKIAVLPIGYFDGLHRHYSGKGHVVIRGQKAPMVGKICMDYMMVDVTDVEGVAVGDPVLIFGSDEFGHVATPEAFSAQSHGDIHELVTCLGPRIPRIFIEE